MPLPEHWATPEDFAALFQYFWHKDFPIGTKAAGARRADWTIHIGIVVRSIADLMGMVARFEHGGRTDAVMRSVQGDEIAVEWEWNGVIGQNELRKLKCHHVLNIDVDSRNRVEIKRNLKFAVLVSYSTSESSEEILRYVPERWRNASWPLLLVLIDWESKNRSSRRMFKNIYMFEFDTSGIHRTLREFPALPWEVDYTRWNLMVR